MEKKLSELYFYLTERKAIRKIVLGLVILNLVLPFRQTKYITWFTLIVLGLSFVSTLMPEENQKLILKQKEDSETDPIIDFRLNIMQTKLVNLTQSYISRLLTEEIDDIKWDWCDEYSTPEYCEILDNGGSVIVKLFSDEYDQAKITLKPIPKVKLINLTYNWFIEYGKEEIRDYVYTVNSQGIKTLVLNSEIIGGFPNEDKWDLVSEYLVDEGYKVALLDNGIEITWPRKIVKKINSLGGVA